jgi:hypothetical protein
VLVTCGQPNKAKLWSGEIKDGEHLSPLSLENGPTRISICFDKQKSQRTLPRKSQSYWH